jgi:hypothetical protein
VSSCLSHCVSISLDDGFRARRPLILRWSTTPNAAHSDPWPSGGVQLCKRCESLRFGTGRQKPLNEGQIPNLRGVRVALGTGYDPGEGNRRAARNGLVSHLPPET